MLPTIRSSLGLKPKAERRRLKPTDVDINLALAAAAVKKHTAKGFVHHRPFSREDLAEICDCTPERIRLIELEALRKINLSPAAMIALTGHMELRTPLRFK